MKKLTIAALFLCTAFFAVHAKPESQMEIGIVNFGNCLSDSKLGKQEQNSFESLKKQMGAMVEETQKELADLAAKMEDQEYLDGLSSESEEAMRQKFLGLKEELARRQNQFYSLMNQTQMRIMQTLAQNIGEAAEKVAKEKNLSCVLNKELCFYNAATLDVTEHVIAEMDKHFDEIKKAAHLDAAGS